MKIYSAMALVEVKGTNRRVSGCSGGFNSVSIDTVSVIDTQSTEKLTSVCSKGSAASSFSNTSHRGAFPGGLSVHQGSFLIMNLCQFLMILQQIRFHRDDNLSVLTRKDIVHKSKTMRFLSGAALADCITSQQLDRRQRHALYSTTATMGDSGCAVAHRLQRQEPSQE